MTGAGPDRRISLALTLHNHQPIGNFGWVFAEVFEQAYQPMVEALERHPRVRVGLHYTGPLLEWLRAERPGVHRRRFGRLVDRGQVEILGGGLYEPVLASLPERDRVGQLARMADTVEATFGARPKGAWLAERVWEPDLPTSLAAAGYGWTILDDSHFRAAAIPEDAMWGPYTTDDQGRLLTVFGTEQGLRYLIPFHEVDEVIEYLREHATEAGDRLGTMGDDGEKFGAWPTTWEHCWGKGRWVERFFERARGQRRLADDRPPERLAREQRARSAASTSRPARTPRWASGRSRPTRAASSRRRCSGARDAKSPEVRWLRGAFWRNFQVKYREINDLHKQMLRTSAKVEAMAPGPARDAALDHLYRGQSNDCYWHGLFGGIYIAHMRAATLAHLIAAEDLADAAAGRVGGQRAARPRPRRARRGPAGERGPGRRRRARRGRRDRVVGPPRRAARAHRRAPPPSRGVPRDAAPPRAQGRRGCREGLPRPRRPATPRHRSTSGSRSRRPASPIASCTTTTSVAAA